MLQPPVPTKANYNKSLHTSDYLDTTSAYPSLPYTQMVLLRAGKSRKKVSLPSINTKDVLSSLPKINKSRRRLLVNK